MGIPQTAARDLHQHGARRLLPSRGAQDMVPGGGSGRAEPATLQAPAERRGWEEASQKTES